MTESAANQQFEARLTAYLDLLLQLGVNIQPGQNLVINASPAPLEETASIMRRLVRRAYELGARNVYPQWNDAETARTRMSMAPAEALTDVETWRIKWFEELNTQGTPFLSILAPDPDLYAGIDPQRIRMATQAGAKASQNFSASTQRNEHPWCVAAVASRAWATKAFPGGSEAERVAALWDYIFKATRMDTPDPVAAWREHIQGLVTRANALDGANLARLRYQAPGTDLTVTLPDGYHWIGGSSATASGQTFAPNLPTEEVFCLPKRDGVDGTVSATMPLNYNGVLVEGIRLTLESGRIVQFSADRGEDALRSIIETDEGSRYLGEIALVPANSPINIGRPVFNTLFDENASCHVAIGAAYPTCVRGGERMSPDELRARGVNQSAAHVDFMIGSDALDIDGETADGRWIPIFRRGLWALPA